MTRAARPLTFRVYAGPRAGRGLYILARVFETQAAMLATLRLEGKATGEGFGSDIVALTQPRETRSVSKHGPWRLAPCLGRVNFHRGRMGTEVVTHEFAHAALAWAARIGLAAPFVDDAEAEEAFCLALGRMASRFVARAHRLKLYDE